MRGAFETAKHLFAPLTANCREFHEQWRAAGRPADAADLSGRWIGQWLSATTGHGGPLRSVLVMTSPHRWHARFHARYARILRACYVTELHAAETPGGRYTLSGRSDLGWAAGGLYEYDGEASETEFICRYRSRLDEGEFRLRRPPAP